MAQRRAHSVELLNSWPLRYEAYTPFFVVLEMNANTNRLDFVGQEVWPRGRLVGFWCLDLPDASTAVSLPR